MRSTGPTIVPIAASSPDVEERVRQLADALRSRLVANADAALALAASLRELREVVPWLRETHATLGGQVDHLETVARNLRAEALEVDRKLTRREPMLERVDHEHAQRIAEAREAAHV